jgi:RNA polymerase sigma-70 factor (ECF subfamily)
MHLEPLLFQKSKPAGNKPPIRRILLDVQDFMADARTSMDVRLLVDQHYELLYRYGYRLSGSAAEAEDLTQETFCTAQQRIGQLRDSAHARGWLCTILRNHYLQARRHRAEICVESLEEMAIDPEQPADAHADIDSERLQAVLGELPEVYRTPIILFYFEEFSYRQIANQMGVPIGTVMSRLARAKAYLRSRLRAEFVALHPATSTPGVS